MRRALGSRPIFLREIAQNALRFPDKLAASHGTQAVSYRELLENAGRLAGSIGALPQPQGPVLACLPNSIGLLELMLGCFLAGACLAPVSPVALPSVLARVSPGLLVTTPETLQSLATGPAHAEMSVEPDWPALLSYTSGTTGIPKGTLHSYASLDRLTVELARKLNYDSSDRSLLYLPMDTPFCLTSQILPALYAGATLVILDGFEAAHIVDCVRHQSITRLYMHGHKFQQLTLLAEPVEKNQLRSCVAGAELCTASMNAAFEQAFGVPVIQSMGMVETLAHSLNLSSRPDKRGSAGTPLCGARIQILDQQDRSLPAGEVGEIVVETPLLMVGYFGQPPIQEGRFRTGDLGYVDEDGYLWFLGRQAAGQGYELLRRMQLLNDDLYAINGVVEAAVVAADSPDQLVAFVSLKQGDPEPGCIEQLARLACRCEFLPALPKLLGGKLDVATMQQLATGKRPL